MSPSRLHVLPAADSAVVIRRGPSRWWHVLQWRFDPPEVEPGAWFRGQLYPRRCDVSPDGSLLGYFALAGRPPPWDSYLAVSKAPWLHALAAWHQGSTWGWGCEFLPDGSFCAGDAEPGPPTSGTFRGTLARRPPLPKLSHPDPWRARDVQRELRRGWAEHDVSADAASPLVLRRPRPGDDGTALHLVHDGHELGGGRTEGAAIHYRLDQGGELAVLGEAAWADWTTDGRLLVATTRGELRIASVTPTGVEPIWSHDLSDLRPDPAPAPEWARRW